jgi:hypothetical protein
MNLSGNDDQSKGTGTAVLGTWIRASPLISAAAIVVYAAAGGFSGGATFWSVLAVGGITLAAAFIAGALAGFIFGLPRTLAQTDSKALLATNSNLDQISDWLTKILIGLGLVQLGAIADGVDGLAESIAPGLGGGPGAKTFAAGLLIYSAADGFLVGYLWTRIVISFRLKQARSEEARATEFADALSVPLPPPPPEAPDAIESNEQGNPLRPPGSTESANPGGARH